MDKNELFDTTIGSYEDYKESKRKLNVLLGNPEKEKKGKYDYLIDNKMRELCKFSR